MHKKPVRILILSLLLTLSLQYLNAQGVAINTDGTDADASSMLDVKSTSAGMLIPRMTQTQRDGIGSPATSLLIYQTDNDTGYYYYDGSAWVRLSVGDEVDPTWDGDANTTSNVGRSGKVGIGTTSPVGKLHVEHSGTIGTTAYTMENAWLRVGALGFDPNEITTDGDLYITGQNFIRLGSGSNNSIMQIDPSNRIGIGTTSPTAQLHTTGSIRFANFTNGFLQVDGSGNVSIGSGSDYFTAGDGLSWSGNTLNSLWKENGSHIYNGNSGNVGVGISLPEARLQTYDGDGTSDFPEVTTKGDIDLYLRRSNQGIEFGQGGASNARRAWILARHQSSSYGQYYSTLHLQPDVGDKSQFRGIAIGYLAGNTVSVGTGLAVSDNVGIGTTSPSEKLDVSGNIHASGIVFWGNSDTRTETRADAGLQGDAGAKSGFFETSGPSPSANWPSGAGSWWHLLDVRHNNPTNNYAMQFAGSFFDQKLYFRKTNNNAAQPWNEITTSATETYKATSLGSNVTIPNTWFTDVSGMTLTFTAKKSTALVMLTASGHGYTNSMSHVNLRIWNSTTGSSIGGCSNKIQAYDDVTGTVTVWATSYSKVISGLTAGNSYTLKVQGSVSGIYGTDDAVIYPSTYPDAEHMTLTVFY